MYTREYEFRYSDLDNKGKIKTSTVVDLLQDISIAHADFAGLGALKMAEMKVACLLEGWRIRFDAELDPYEKVQVSTGIMEITTFETVRKYEIRQNGELKITATAVWFTVNTERRRITRAPEEFKTSFDCINEESNNFPFERFKPEKEIDEISSFVVQLRDLDTNNHVNNMKSAEIALNYLPEDFCIDELHIRYRKEITKDEKISHCGKKIEGGWCYELKNEKGEANVMLRVYERM